jgi:hypothetical protein
VNFFFLIIGFGEIGKKHYIYLKESYPDCKIFIISNHFKKYKDCLKDIYQIAHIKFNLIIISNDTNLHLSTLKNVRAYFKSTPILVEKPLLIKSSYKKFKKNIYINYNLRFHPLIKKIKDYINNHDFFYCSLVCNSYLPLWRKGNYRNYYSASKKRGGGVLYDLSHEFDLLKFFFRKYNINYSINKKISNLKINSNDYLQANGSLQKKNQCFNIFLTYFGKDMKREIYLEGNNVTIIGCLLKNRIIIIKNNKKKILYFKKFKIKNTFKTIYKKILTKKIKDLSNFNDSLFLTKIFNKIQLNKK